MICEIIAAGSEMLTPHRQDTNSLWLTGRLNDLGVSVAFKTITGDKLDHLTQAAQIALARTDIVIFSGGLGPTEDDLTREAVAAALGLGLERSAELIADLYKRFAARRMKMPENNIRQADVIAGAVVLENKTGSASGQWLDTVYNGHRKIIILLPGPPKELMLVFNEQCVPRLAAVLPPRHIAKRVLRMALIPESQVDERTAPIYKKFRDVETTILAHPGEIQLHFQCAKQTLEEAQARVDLLAGKIEDEMGDAIFSSQNAPLEEVVLLLLGMKQQTLATAESCTGGMIAERLTSISGSSRSFLGGAVVYSNELKSEFAGVPAELIAQHGAVSKQVAAALADGIRKRTGASLGVSVTGIAGPSGGTEEKPVGLVYIGLSDGRHTEVKKLSLTGGRERIRFWASQHALEMLRLKLLI